jgi:signal recognition particle subunit SRP54
MGSALKDLPIDDRELDQTEAIIHSMTPRERARPDVIDASRRRRIARGSGMDPQDVAGIVKSFGQVREMVRQMQGAGAFGGGGRKAVAQQMAQIDLFGGHQRKKRMRSKRKKKDRKKRSR